MAAKVISIVNQKGGVGKTTIATNVTHALHLQGHKVMLIDSDPQGSARTWSAECTDEIFPVIGLDRENLPRELKKISKGYDWIVIDGAPQLTKMSAAAVAASDVVIIPVQPSPYDVWATEDLVEIVKTRQAIRPNLKAAFLISRVIKKTKLSNEVRAVLDDFELPILKNSTTQSVHYPTTAARGQTVFSAPEHQVCNEVKKITLELIELSLEEEVVNA